MKPASFRGFLLTDSRLAILYPFLERWWNMFDPSGNHTTEQERVILRKLRVWIAALAVACLIAGIGIGAILSGRTTIAQSDLQVARAPEALSASFAEIARRVEPAVVNIETTQVQTTSPTKTKTRKTTHGQSLARDVSQPPATRAAWCRQRVHRESEGPHPDQPSRRPGRCADQGRFADR